MAKWLRQRFAKPLLPGSNPGGASIEKSATFRSAGFQRDEVAPDENRRFAYSSERANQKIPGDFLVSSER